MAELRKRGKQSKIKNGINANKKRKSDRYRKDGDVPYSQDRPQVLYTMYGVAWIITGVLCGVYLAYRHAYYMKQLHETVLFFSSIQVIIC